MVRNFRNLASIELQLLPGTVIVGENRAGKSNLLHALRLILDSGLSFADRQLTREDFWDGLSDGTDSWDPMAAGEVIEASVDIVEFEHDAKLVTALADALLEESPLRARLTYRFAPIDTGTDEQPSTPKYRGAVYGGTKLDRAIATELRSYLHLLFLHALRDVESDIKNWRRSPLRSLLQGAAAAASESELGDVRQSMREANDKLNDLDVVRDLGTSIGQRLLEMVGPNQAVDTELAAAPEDPLRLIRGMRLFVDGDAHRGLGSASLGTLNVLYLALQELGLDARMLDVSDIAHVVMAIEEPEAHLHPHLQRLVFSRLLDHPHTTLVTTQSPHIASVADPRSMVVLRTVGNQTVAAAAHRADLGDAEWDDIARYLDATRAELVFARRVLLVEGFAEQVLVPRLAETLGMNLDKLGISVCAIHGTHFASYVQFCDALGIPWAIATDGDADSGGVSHGDRRATALLELLGETGEPSAHGIFVGTSTFEYDLVAEGSDNLAPCFDTLKELCATPSIRTVESWRDAAPSYDDFMKVLKNAGGKGRYAQRLALRKVRPPMYVADALRYLEQQ